MSTICPRFVQITVTITSAEDVYLLALDENGRVWRRLVPLEGRVDTFKWQLLPNDSEQWDGRRTTEAK